MGTLSTAAFGIAAWARAKFGFVDKRIDALLAAMEQRDAKLEKRDAAAVRSRDALHAKLDAAVTASHETAVKVGRLEGRLQRDERLQ